MAKSYIVDHLTASVINEEDPEFIAELCSTQNDLVRVRFQSRHSNQKHHIATVQFDGTALNPILGHYCTCISGSREVGCCVHIAAVVWHTGVQRATIDPAIHPLSAIKSLQSIHDSLYHAQVDDESNVDNHIRYSLDNNDVDDNESFTTDSDDS